MNDNIRKIKRELRNFAYDPSADYWNRQEEAFKNRDKSTYDKFTRKLVSQFRRYSLAFDLYVGEHGYQEGYKDEENLLLITGTDGIIEEAIEALHRAKADGVDLPAICGNLSDDLYDLQKIDEYYWSKMTPEPVEATSALVKRTCVHFNAALRAYALVEKRKGFNINEFENMMQLADYSNLFYLYWAITTGDYDTSHCAYSHRRY